MKRSRSVALLSVAALIVLLGSCGGENKPAFNDTPTVTGLFPSNITAGSDAFMMSVTGTGFIASSTGVTFVSWNGSPRSTSFNANTGQLSVQIFASDVATPSALNGINISATNPAPGGGTSPASSLAQFTVTQQVGGLTITSLDPSSAKAGSPAFSLTVNGTGFNTNYVVTWNGIGLPTTIAPMSTTTAAAQVSRDLIATEGSAAVAVATPDQVSATVSQTFTITGSGNNTTPKISSLSPASATAGGGDFQMLIKGSGFASTAFVEFNGTFCATAFLSSSQLVALVPAADIATKVNPNNVTVTNPAPGGGTSGAATFTIN